jgi:hypothetical protein
VLHNFSGFTVRLTEEQRAWLSVPGNKPYSGDGPDFWTLQVDDGAGGFEALEVDDGAGGYTPLDVSNE